MMFSTIDVTAVVRGALRANAFANSGNLPPTRLDTLAMQLAQFLNADTGEAAVTLGHTLSQQGVGLHSLLAVWQAVQAQHLRYNAPGEVLETGRRMSELIESYVEHQLSRVRAEQERLRRAVQHARPF